MRKILMLGTALCHPPLSNGVETWVPESEAWLFASTGEATYVNPADAVSDARVGELQAATRMAALGAWANLGVTNPTDSRYPNPYLAPPDADEIKRPQKFPPYPTTTAAVYG